MASPEILIRDQAIALQEAIQTIEGLLGEGTPSPRLYSALHDAAGQTMPEFVFAMVVSELTRVVADQQEQIYELEAKLASLAGKKTTAKAKS
jgi:hypothetical protein